MAFQIDVAVANELNELMQKFYSLSRRSNNITFDRDEECLNQRKIICAQFSAELDDLNTKIKPLQKRVTEIEIERKGLLVQQREKEYTLEKKLEKEAEVVRSQLQVVRNKVIKTLAIQEEVSLTEFINELLPAEADLEVLPFFADKFLIRHKKFPEYAHAVYGRHCSTARTVHLRNDLLGLQKNVSNICMCCPDVKIEGIGTKTAIKMVAVLHGITTLFVRKGGGDWLGFETHEANNFIEVISMKYPQKEVEDAFKYLVCD